LFPTSESDQLLAEVYLFDTLSGGAGYSSWVGGELSEVLGDVRNLLTSCTCERTCYNCLRNYSNQFVHTHLDRDLGLRVLDYALSGALPEMDDAVRQQRSLSSLRRFLQLSGVTIMPVGHNGIPLTVERNGRRLAIGTAHGLFGTVATSNHPLHVQARRQGMQALVINEYLLTRNLSAVHRDVLDRLL
jgi:hypothetical protein